MQRDETINTAIGFSLSETIDRYGSAASEFLKGFRGVDHETGQRFSLSLQDVSGYRINPDPAYTEKNINQQAGYAAEIVKTGRENAEHIINRSAVRVSRTEDVAGYGKNHPQFDHVEAIGGRVVDGTHSQMKFVNDPLELMKNIAEGHGGGKKDFSRYLEADWIDLPSEQVAQAAGHCRNQAEKLREQASLMTKEGKAELAERFNAEADKYEVLGSKIRDSGITREEARDYRLRPEWETSKDIGRISHRAGLEGAKFGAALAGCISLLTNLVASHSGEKQLSEAAEDIALATVKSAGIGYATAFAGSAIKGFMQQSSSAYTRSLASTSLPVLAVSVSMATGRSIHRYALGEIDELQLLHEVGGTVSGMMSSTALSAVGQVVVPIPVVGAMVGGMVGYTVSSLFYQSYLQAFRDQRLAHEHYLFVREKCEAARDAAQSYRAELEVMLTGKLESFGLASGELVGLFHRVNEVGGDEFALAIDTFADQLGQRLRFASQQEFDAFMASKNTLVL